MNKKITIKITITFVILNIIMVCAGSQVNAVKLTCSDAISVGQTLNVTLDFEEYVAAYDSLTVSYNEKVLEYVSDNELVEKLWWDNTSSSAGIKSKVYKFVGIADGISTISVEIEGLVSASSNMEVLGDYSLSKKVTVGDGYVLGDVDGDGDVDAVDAALALDIYKYGGTSDEKERADVDGDGDVDAVDAALILDIYKYGN